MAETSTPTSTPLSAHGINVIGDVHWNLNTDALIDICLYNGLEVIGLADKLKDVWYVKNSIE